MPLLRQALPYHLLLDLVRSLLGLAGWAGEAETRAALRSALARLADEERRGAEPYLAHLLSLPLAPEEATAVEALGPEVRHQRLLASLDALLRGLAIEAPLVLVCEDVHWADVPSVEALEGLLPAVTKRPILLVVTCRPDPDTPGWALVGSARRTLGDSVSEIRRFRKRTADTS